MLLLAALVLSAFAPNFAGCSENAPAIAVKIDIPETSSWDGKTVYPRRLENRYPDYDKFSVIIENVSAEPVLLSGADWGNLTFEATDENGKKTFIHRVEQLTNGKIPPALRLEPGEASVRIIHYASMKYGQPSEWEPFPFPRDPHRTETVRKITLRAVYEQEVPANHARTDFWIGRAVSKPYEVVLEDNALLYTDGSVDFIADGIQMSLSILMTNRETEFEVAFKNVGQEDVCLNLGMMLGNGKVQIPDKVHLELKDESGNTWEHFFPQGGAVAGRVDDYVVPLKTGSTYAFTVPLGEFWSSDMKKQHERELGPGRYDVTARFEGVGAQAVNLDMQGIKLMKFWKGKLEEGIVTVIQ